MPKWLDRLTANFRKNPYMFNTTSYLRSLVTGSYYKLSDLRGVDSVQSIKTQVDTMRALAEDSQVSTALSYYATDATTPNSNNQIIWATNLEGSKTDVAQIINAKFKQWDVNTYALDHILELATIGNLYLPTTLMYKDDVSRTHKNVVIDNNTVKDDNFEVVASYKIPPKDILHVWKKGIPEGYMYQPDSEFSSVTILPEDAVIHFTLGGLLGDYTIDTVDSNQSPITYDIQFGRPLMDAAVQPTRTLSLFEDALLLASLNRAIKFINVECGNAEEDEIRTTLESIKDIIEQRFSLNTANGDAQSYIDPQSPNNLIYLARVNGTDPISITDLNMAEATDADSKLLNYYQDKKLSVLGVPKEAMNFSSSEGLGGAGAVMSQRSALYANSLARLETAYKEGWRKAINVYMLNHNLPGFVDQFELHMNPIITQMSTVTSERRDSALGQAQQIVELMKSVGMTDADDYKTAIEEILIECLPTTGSRVSTWDIDVNAGGEEGAF